MTSPVRPRAAGLRRDYRPHLDGARAIAVFLVVAFHSGIDNAGGGFVGVDLFFVLSGYLVTGLVIGELEESGTLSFRDFYARRIRRLLPMALLVLVISGLVFAALSPPLIVKEATGSFTAAFLYVANWWFIAESTEYIGSDIETSPILHFWSLAIEEQFYFVWPILLVAAHRGRRRLPGRGWAPVAVVVVAAGIASLAAALVIGDGNVDRAYYGTDTRAYQLLLGAALAMLPLLTARWFRATAPFVAAGGLVALGVLTTDALDWSPITRGATAAAATAVLLVALESGHAGWVARGLASPPLAALGRLSYSIYLWHLPVMYVLRDQTDLGPVGLLVVATPVSVALSAASAWVLENPVRHSSRLRPIPRVVVAGGLALSLIGGVVFVPIVVEPDTTSTIRLAAAPEPDGSQPDGSGAVAPADVDDPASEPEELVIDWEAIRKDRSLMPECRPADPTECTVVEGEGAHVLMIGDSHAEVWSATFVPLAEQEDLTYSVAWSPRCSWHLDTMVVIAEDIRQACYDRQNEWYDQIVPALDPDLVLLVHRATFDPARPFFATPEGFLAASDIVVERLRAAEIEVVIVEPLPITAPENDPLACLSEGRSADECSFDATADPTVLEEHYRELGALDGVASVDLDGVACPRLPRCDIVVDGVVAWRDQSHLTATYAATLVGDVLASGVLDGVHATTG